MAAITHVDFVNDAIRRALNERTRVIVAEEAQKAAEAVSRRVNNEADSIALHLLKEYDIRTDGENVLITVRKSQ